MRAGSSTSLSSGFEVSSSSASLVDENVVKKVRTYYKFFCNRLAQILVQSRTNECFDLPCSPPGNGGSDWFNVRVEELGEVSAQMKKYIQRNPSDGSRFSVDFLLYTVDGDILPLETWCFSLDDDRKTVEDNCSTLYHQLGVLLRSAMCAARITPMHRYYVKKQGPETFVVLYRLIDGSSTLDLGSESKSVQIGSFPTPLGSLNLDLSYRTRMEIDRRVEHNSSNNDSFQQLQLGSPGTTPEAPPILGSSGGTPGSFCDDISNFSTSPASMAASPSNLHYTTSPPTTTFCMGSVPFQVGSAPLSLGSGGPSAPFYRRARSRTHSARSNTSVDSNDSHSLGSDKLDRDKKLSQSQMIAKDLPFANLLSLSFTGALYPLHTLTEDVRESCVSEKTQKENDQTIIKGPNSPMPFEMEMSATASTVVASTICDTVQNSQHADESEDSEGEVDEDSFVKIPLFGALSSENVDEELSEIITTFKAVCSLKSLEKGENLTTMAHQIATFERTQCLFDEFVAEMKDKHDNL